MSSKGIVCFHFFLSSAIKFVFKRRIRKYHRCPQYHIVYLSCLANSATVMEIDHDMHQVYTETMQVCEI